MTDTPGLTRSSQSLMRFGISLAHQEHDGRGVRRAVVRQPLLPVAGSSFARSAIASMSYASASVTTSASSPSITERACLPEPPCDCLISTFSGLLLPVLGEGRVEVLVQLARRIVRHVQQRDVAARGHRAQHGPH